MKPHQSSDKRAKFERSKTNLYKKKMVFPSVLALSAHIQDIKSSLYMTYKPNSRGLIEFNRYAEVPSLIARFVVEECRGNNLVHIRSCYKNEYWCRASESDYIVAAANKPEEDRSKDNCTLFEATMFGSEVQFTHVKTGLGLAYCHNNNSSWSLCLGSKDGPSLRLKVVDFGTLVRLPKRVILLGDNGRYLRGKWLKSRPTIGGGFPIGGLIGIIQYETSNECEYNEFTAKNGAERSSHYEIKHYNGFVRIKSLHFGNFLRASKDQGKIYGDEKDNTINNVDTLFEVNTLGRNAINLRNLGNNKVCRRMSTVQVDDCLFASESYGVPESKLIVQEPVLSRRIHVQYRVEDARIISRKFISMINKSYTNYSKDTDDEHSVGFKYKKSRTTKWSTSTTTTDGTKTEINLKIPKLNAGAKIEVSQQTTQITSFEEESSFSQDANTDFKFKLRPMTMATVKGYVKEVTFEIPFSYFQTVVYTTGERDEVMAEDGVCRSVETCDYFDKKEARL